MYIIHILAQVHFVPARLDVCPMFARHPLPSTRDLWQAKSELAWIKEYNAWSAEILNPCPLVVGYLKGMETGQSFERMDLARRLTLWSQKADAFGVIVWLTSQLARQRSGEASA